MIWLLFWHKKLGIQMDCCKPDDLGKYKNVISVHNTFSGAQDNMIRFYKLRKDKANRDAAYFRQRLVRASKLKQSDWRRSS